MLRLAFNTRTAVWKRLRTGKMIFVPIKNFPATLGLMALTFLNVFPAMAKDKDHIELTCGKTKATITCTKFQNSQRRDGVCVASSLRFLLQDGSYLSPEVHGITQEFAVPKIADAFACTRTRNSVYFSIQYSPDCDAAMCVQYFTYTENGIILTRNGKQEKSIAGSKDLSYGEWKTIRNVK